MFRPKTNFKDDPEKQWNLPDRIFFGFGACHILAGVFLEITSYENFHGEWIVPSEGYSGHHMFVTNGVVAFDYHGYSWRKDLVDRYWVSQKEKNQNWDARIMRIDFSLLDTTELNARNHRGPDQYFDDPLRRAKQFIINKRVPSKYHERLVLK